MPHDPKAREKRRQQQLKDLVLRLSRHLLNPDEMSLPTWGARGLDLLVEVRELMPKEYDCYVKGKSA